MRIEGTHIVLRDDRRDADDEDFFRWLNLEEWNCYDEPDKSFTTRAEFEKQLEERGQRPAEPSLHSHNWQIDTVAGRHIGRINTYRWDERARRTYIGICLPEETVWGKGYGTEAIRLLLEYLFGEMGLKGVRAATWTGNRRMMRCAQRWKRCLIGAFQAEQP